MQQTVLGRGSYLKLIDSCITQLKAQGPSRTCNESKEEDDGACVQDEKHATDSPLEREEEAGPAACRSRSRTSLCAERKSEAGKRCSCHGCSLGTARTDPQTRILGKRCFRSKRKRTRSENPTSSTSLVISSDLLTETPGLNGALKDTFFYTFYSSICWTRKRDATCTQSGHHHRGGSRGVTS